ncbi:TPA: restriction endonuclease subunit S [Photobacterium damselae]
MRFKADELTTYISRGIAPKYTEIIDGAATVVNQKCIRDYQVNLELARLNDLSKRKVPTEKLVQKYDVLVNSTGVGTLGRVGQFLGNEANLTVDTHVTIVRPDKDVIDPLFFGYLMKSKQSLIESFATGTTGQTELSRDSIKEMEVSFVENREHQQAIGNFLLAIDRKLQLNKATNQTLEQMAQAIFKSWFVDFDPVRAKMNGEQPVGMDAATASLFPEKLVESELGLIPEGWEASKLENLVDIASSKRVFAKEYLEEGVPFYRGKEITELSKGNSVTPEIYISEERYQELKDKAGAPKEGDILITSVGTIGNTYLVDSDDKFYFKDGNLTWVKDYKDEEIPYFLMEWFKSAVGKCAIENIKIGSTQQAITIKSLNGIKLVNPSNDIHKNFTNLIAPLYQKHRANIKQSKALANLRDTLLPKLLSGEIELGTSEELVEAI